MKLLHYKLENAIDFDQSDVWTLVCENPTHFAELSEELYRQTKGGQGGWTLLNDKNSDLSKIAVTLIDYFALSLSDKKAANLLQEQLKKLAFDENHTVATHEIIAALQKYFFELVADIDYPTSVGEADFSQISKMVSVSFCDEADNLFQKLCDYVTLISRLTPLKLLVCLNLRSYLNEQQLELFYRHCMQNGINLLCMENHYNQVCSDERVLVCDSDLCEFFPRNVL